MIVTRKTPIDGFANTVLGADANFWFFNNVTATAFFAQSETGGSEDPPLRPTTDAQSVGTPNGVPYRDRTTYRAELEWAPDRYGVRYEHLLVGSAFQPEVGFLRRSAFRRNFASARFSPRPAGNGKIRRHVLEAEFDHIAGTTDGVLETREAQVAYKAELRGNDQITIDYSRNYEFLRTGFNVVPGKLIPAGGYHFGDVRASYVLGPQRRFSGTISGGTGSFYDGTNTEVGYRGVIEISPRFNVEPGVTLNWIRSSPAQVRSTPP